MEELTKAIETLREKHIVLVSVIRGLGMLAPGTEEIPVESRNDLFSAALCALNANLSVLLARLLIDLIPSTDSRAADILPYIDDAIKQRPFFDQYELLRQEAMKYLKKAGE